jgi:hypothetical protein
MGPGVRRDDVMTELAVWTQFNTRGCASAFSRRDASEACVTFGPHKSRGRRESRVRAAPAVSCAEIQVIGIIAFCGEGQNPACNFTCVLVRRLRGSQLTRTDGFRVCVSSALRNEIHSEALPSWSGQGDGVRDGGRESGWAPRRTPTLPGTSAGQDSGAHRRRSVVRSRRLSSLPGSPSRAARSSACSARRSNMPSRGVTANQRPCSPCTAKMGGSGFLMRTI